MKIIVTGGAGFIGSAVCRLLAGQKKIEVLNLDKLTYAADLRTVEGVSSLPNYRFVKQDICSRAELDRIFDDFQPDAVMHLAAESHVDRSIDGPSEFIQTNLVGHSHCWRQHGIISTAYLLNDGRLSGFIIFRLTRCMVRLGTRGFLQKKPPMRRIRHILQARRDRITWCAPGIIRMGCR